MKDWDVALAHWNSKWNLGRPTLRGIRKCPKCGTINGTRGNSCKNKSCDIVFRDIGKKKLFTEACKLVSPHHLSDYQIFSVRRRDRGPDYRNFVRIPCDPSQVVTPIELSPSQKCFVEACNVRGRQFPCQHLQSVEKCVTTSKILPIKHSVVSSLNIPSEHKDMISHYLNSEMAENFVQRVSSTSFVIRCDVNPKFPLGLLHVMVKPNKHEGSDKFKFFCSCRPNKQLQNQSRDADLLSTNGNNGYENKYCVHYYTCLCAFASDESLASEFDYLLLPFTSEFSSTLLSQLHLPSSNNGGRDSIEILDVEIMRENMSLLESIADDSSLANVQGLEGVLQAAQDIRVFSNLQTDGFSLDANSGLDDLSEADQQVCQIFANSQNMQLQSAFTSSSSPEAGNSLEPNCSLSKKRKEDYEKVIEDTESIICSSNYEKPAMCRKIRSATSKSQQKSNSNTNAIPFIVSISPSPITSTSSNAEKKMPSLLFEQWLAGINERINLLMNYKLCGKPEPLVYFVHHEFFDVLKERIGNTGLKKRRLPNQTSLVSRNDRSLTKYTWKITSLNHLLNIFSCNLVSLKPTQQFIKVGSSSYKEWVEPTMNTDPTEVKNNLPAIAPILHSTTLKIGKPEYNLMQQKELSAFTIEFIPDVLPICSTGELILTFEFEHSNPPK